MPPVDQAADVDVPLDDEEEDDAAAGAGVLVAESLLEPSPDVETAFFESLDDVVDDVVVDELDDRLSVR
ncbi:hypothetical protein Pth03_12460 [Planotetraspora thailandica]|uniref:Uncharacterized protein n=1 Tax=Planotetraspora thailandica TaxID=487172 RepID=A0A8J3UZQ9_9ACTN|nr:hypothetical protein [Planotetraspora thailandica]GII52857.1 hypothetical protein Pth03_12460 [Planotetraspora thailandica]